MSVTRLVYEIPADTDHVAKYIDLARDLSIINRKLIRQKQIFTVMGGMMKDSGGSELEFSTVPMTWTTKLAVNRGFKQWRKLQSQTYKRIDGLRPPKYNDFKVYLDIGHNRDRTLDPVYSSGKPHAVGEWNQSTLVQPKLIDPDGDGGLEFDANADEWEMHIIGGHMGDGGTTTTADGQTFYANLTRVGLIKSWVDSRNLPYLTAPNNTPPGIRTDPLSNLFDVEDDDSEMAHIIQSENDQAPYVFNNVQGAGSDEFQLVSYCDNSSGEPDIVTIPGFQAICGLIRIDLKQNNGSLLILDVQTEGERF